MSDTKSTNAYGVTTKIDLRKIIDDGVKRIHEIRGMDTAQSGKTQEEKRLAARVKRLLMNEDGRKKAPKLTIHTLNAYLTKVRKAFTATGYKHHQFESKLNALIKKHRAHEDFLKTLFDLSIPKVSASIREYILVLLANRQKLARQTDKDKLDTFIEQLKRLPVVPVFITDLQLNDLERAERVEKVTKVLKEKKSDQIKLDVEKVHSLITSLFRSTRPADLALGISIATGRRAIETIIQGVFEPINEFEMKFSGQAKDRTKVKSYTIPTLVSTCLINDALIRLRDSQKVKDLNQAMTDAETTNDFYTPNETFNNQSRMFTLNATERLQTLGNKATGWTFKDSRAIYARLSYDLYKSECIANKKKVMDEGDFFSVHLGHSDELAKENYKVFYSVGTIVRVSENDLKTHDEDENARALKRIERLIKFASSNDIKESRLTDKVMKLVDALKENDSTIVINNAYLRKHVKGKTDILGRLMVKLTAANLTTI